MRIGNGALFFLKYFDYAGDVWLLSLSKSFENDAKRVELKGNINETNTWLITELLLCAITGNGLKGLINLFLSIAEPDSIR